MRTKPVRGPSGPKRSHMEASCMGSVMVSNLPDGAGERALRDLFEPFGEVRRVVFVFERSGDSRARVGFVEMATADAAASAASANDDRWFEGLRLRAETYLWP